MAHQTHARAIEGDVQRRLGLTGPGDGPRQPYHGIAQLLRPQVQVGVLDNGHRHHLGMGPGHVPGHAAAHTAHRFAGFRLGSGSTLHIGLGNQPIVAAALQFIQRHTQALGQSAGLRRGAYRPGRLTGWCRTYDEILRGQIAVTALGGEIAHHGTAVLPGALELDQRRADVQQVPRRTKTATDHPGPG